MIRMPEKSGLLLVVRMTTLLISYLTDWTKGFGDCYPNNPQWYILQNSPNLRAQVPCLLIKQFIALLLDEVSVAEEELHLRWPIIGDRWLDSAQKKQKKQLLHLVSKVERGGNYMSPSLPPSPCSSFTNWCSQFTICPWNPCLFDTAPFQFRERCECPSCLL